MRISAPSLSRGVLWKPNTERAPQGGQSKQLCSEYRNKYINQAMDKSARSISKHQPCLGPDLSSVQSQRGALLVLSDFVAAARLIYSSSLCSVAPTQGLCGAESSGKQGMVRILLPLDANPAEEITTLLLGEKIIIILIQETLKSTQQRKSQHSS